MNYLKPWGIVEPCEIPTVLPPPEPEDGEAFIEYVERLETFEILTEEKTE